jgi:hypothetical protein
MFNKQLPTAFRPTYSNTGDRTAYYIQLDRDVAAADAALMTLGLELTFIDFKGWINDVRSSTEYADLLDVTGKIYAHNVMNRCLKRIRAR